MKEQHACGPDVDKEFFSEIGQVMLRYPSVAKKYRVSCTDHETEIMKIDFAKEVSLKSIKGRKITTEFGARPREARAKEPRMVCCGWCPRGDGGFLCCDYWLEKR